MTQYSIKNWSTFQHYKDRNPPWIKLQKSLLDNYEFQSLPVASRALAPMLWLLASEYQDPKKGIIEGDSNKIAFRMRMSVKEFDEAIEPLILRGFIEPVHDASNAIAERKRDAMPETETEAYRKEAEAKKESSAVRTILPAWLPLSDWNDFCEFRSGTKFTAKAKQLLISKLDKLRSQGHDPGLVLQQSIMNGWKGVFELKGTHNGKNYNGNTQLTGHAALAALHDAAAEQVAHQRMAEMGLPGPHAKR